MSSAVQYHVIDPALEPGAQKFRCPSHRSSEFRYVPGVDGGEVSGGDCTCYTVARVASDGRIVVMIIAAQEEPSTLRKFMGRANAI